MSNNRKIVESWFHANCNRMSDGKQTKFVVIVGKKEYEDLIGMLDGKATPYTVSNNSRLQQAENNCYLELVKLGYYVEMSEGYIPIEQRKYHAVPRNGVGTSAIMDIHGFIAFTNKLLHSHQPKAEQSATAAVQGKEDTS